MLRRLLLAAVVVLAVGCGAGSDGSVRGTVTLNGRPLDKGTISFTPADAQGGTAGGEIEAGRYEVARLKPGKYHVHIAGRPDGPIILPGSMEAQKKLTDEEIRALMNPLPADVTGTDQVVEVRAGAQTRDFKLESRGRP